MIIKYLLLALSVISVQGKCCHKTCSQKYGNDSTQQVSVACSRGCRFSAMNQFLNLGPEPTPNSECEKSCTEAYADASLLDGCKFGCNNQVPLNPLGQLMETQSSFNHGPMMPPADFFETVSTFFNDFSSAFSSQMDSLPDGSRPVGFVRIITSENDPQMPQTRVVSVKISNRNGDDGFFGPSFFGSNIFEDENDLGAQSPIIVSSFGQQTMNSKCLGPTYDSLPGLKCKAYIERWQFDKYSKTCQKFIYGGCPGMSCLFDLRYYFLPILFCF